MEKPLEVLTAATWNHRPTAALVALKTVKAGSPQWLPLRPPKQNQKRLSACLISRQPSTLTPAADILSTMDMSPAGAPLLAPGGWLRALKFTQVSTVKSPEDTCRLDALPASTKALIPSREKAWPASPGANVTPPCTVPMLPLTRAVAFRSAGAQVDNPRGRAN